MAFPLLRTRVPLAASILLVAALTGCGGDAAEPATQAGAPAPAASCSAGEICTMYHDMAGKVAKVSGVPQSQLKPQSQEPNASMRICTLKNQTGAGSTQLGISVFGADTAKQLFDASPGGRADVKPRPLEGIGDKAALLPAGSVPSIKGPTVRFYKGGAFVEFNATSDAISEPEAEALMRDLAGRI